MLEWLITGHNLLGATVTTTISIFLVGCVLSTICKGETKARKRLEQFFMILPMVISVGLIGLMLYIRHNTTENILITVIGKLSTQMISTLKLNCISRSINY